MASALELVMLIRADASGLDKGLDEARKKTGGLLDGLGKLGLASIGIGAIKGAVSGLASQLGSVVGAAESAADAKARLDIVLGSDLSGVMQDNATIANQLGMTRTAYLEAAGAASNYLVNLGLSKDSAAEMAMGMTELAPKLAAFANADPSAVTDALQKGVGGSTRGLKALGIAINDDLLKGLDDAGRATEIYRQIQEQSSAANAAWADNQGDVANSMARVSAAMDDAKAAIGERLLPIIAPLMEAFANGLPGAIDVVSGAVSTIIGWFDTARGVLASFFTSTSQGGVSFRDTLLDVWARIKTAVGAVVDWFNANVKPILVAVFSTIAAKVAELKQQFDAHFGGIRGAVAAVVAWFQANVAPTLASVFNNVMAVVGPVVDFLRAHMDEIKLVVSGAIDVVVGVVKVGFYWIKGIIEVVMAALRGDWDGAWEAIKNTAKNIVPGIRQAFGGLWDYLRGLGAMALDIMRGVGANIVAGIRAGIESAWATFTGWIRQQIDKIPLAVRKALGIASPSKVMAAIGRDIIAGLAVGIAEQSGSAIAAIAGIGSALIEAARGALDSHSPSRAFADIGGDVVAGLAGGLGGVADATAPLVDGIRTGIADAASAAEQEAERFSAIGTGVDFAPLQQSIDDLRTTLVDSLAPAAEEAGDKLGAMGSGATIIDMLNNVTRSGQSALPMLAGLASTAATAAGSSGLGALAVALTGPVALAIGAAIAIGAVLYAAWTSNFGGIRDKTLEVVGIVQAKWGELKTKLAQVFGDIWASLQPLRDRFSAAWQAIQDKVAVVVSWIADNAGSILSRVFDGIGAALDGLAAFWRENGDTIVAIVVGAWDAIAGIVRGAWAILSGIVRAGLALLHGDFSGAGKILIETVRGWWGGVRQTLGGLSAMLAGIGKLALDSALSIGRSIVDGIRDGVAAKWDAVTAWVGAQINKIPTTVRKLLGIASPSKVMAEIGEQTVEGLRVGLSGLAAVAAVINETLGRIIGDADRENFKSIAELTQSLLDIFTNTTQALKALLSFDVTTSAGQISAAFDALVGTFETALLRMKGLAQYAGRGDSPIEFLNMFDVQNIETVSKGIQATISMTDGLLGVVEKMATVKMPAAGGILGLLPFLQELGTTAAQFIDTVGTPQGEDATAFFEQGASTTAALASWAKAVADIVGLKFDAVAGDFRAQLDAAADAASAAFDAVREMAQSWADMGVTAREKLTTGVSAYAAAVGAAAGLLKAVAELKIDTATLATRDQIEAAAGAADVVVGVVGKFAALCIEWAADFRDNVVAGVKAYADAAGAAVGLLKTTADLDFTEAVAVTQEQLTRAADLAEMAANEVGRIALWWIQHPGKWADIQEGIKGYAEAAGAAVGLLKATADLDFTKAVEVTDEQLARAADFAAAAYEQLRRVADGFVAMGAEAAGPLVAAVKLFAEGAGAALDMLGKGADGINKLAEVTKLAGVQTGLIAAVMGNMRLAWDEVVKRVPTLSEDDVAKVKAWQDGTGGIFGALSAGAEGINKLGGVTKLSGIQPALIRAILGSVNLAVREVIAGAGSFAAEGVAKAKAWGEASGATIGALVTAADGLGKLSGKMAIPGDLSERVAQLIAAMKVVVGGMAGALSGEGGIDAAAAKAGADVADSVKRIAEAMGPLFDALNAALESPFGRVRATGQRGDTFRQNIANRIKAALVSAVTAVNEAMASLPPLNVPEGLAEAMKRMADAFNPLADLIGKLDGIKSGMKLVPQFASAVALLGAAFAGGGGGAGAGGGGAFRFDGSGGAIQVVVEPTFMPLAMTINNEITAPITVGSRTVEAIAVEVVKQFDVDIKLKPTGP